jgi:CelD/BcsL family acetyltransferase involved in cellulose biosynthesis
LSGAALATALAMGLRAALLFGAARSRLGIIMFVFSGRDAASAVALVEDVEHQADLLSPEEAGRISEDWRELADRAVEPNLFFTPEMALAGMRHLPAESDPQLLVVRRERRLVGVLPVVAARGRWLNPFAVRRSAAFYGTLSTPLLDPERPADTVAAMLRALARHGQHGIVLPYLSCDGPAAGAFTEACARTGFVRVELAQHRRAMLRSALPGSEYIRATLETRRRKEAERQRRRLADLGALCFEVVSSEADTARALDAFLELEAAGWKGKSGTALAHAPGSAKFIREAAAALAHRGAFRVAILALNGRAIASGLIGQAGSRAYYIKTTYDEAYARFSPGLLLTLDLTAHLLDDPGIEDADSIAVADHPMIDRIWIERLAVASVVVSTRPGGGQGFRAAIAAERIRETMVKVVKSFRDRSQATRAAAVNENGKNLN